MTIRRRLFVVGVLATAATVSAATPPTLGKGEGSLVIMALPGTVERGDSDPAYDWVTPFEKKSGCKVTVRTVQSSEEMLASPSRGGIDLVIAPSDVSQRLIAAKRVQPLNLEQVPAYRNVEGRLKRAPWYTVDKRAYGVPLQWGVNLLLYSTTVFREAPNSWSVVFEPQVLPDGKPNRGRIQAYDGPMALADAALYLMHRRPELGIRNPYDLNETQYEAVLGALRRQRALVRRTWHDPTVQMSDFKNEGVAASSSWAYMANALVADHQPVASTIPAEGATGWADTLMLTSDAKNVDCAYRWMEWSLTPRVQAALGEWFGSSPVTKTACREKTPAGGNLCKTDFFDRLADIEFWRMPSGKCRTLGSCVPYSRWISDYRAIREGK